MPGTNPPARPSAVSPRTEDISFPCLDSLRPHSYTFLRSKTEKMLQEIVQGGRDALHRRSTASLISAVEWNAVERLQGLTPRPSFSCRHWPGRNRCRFLMAIQVGQ